MRKNHFFISTILTSMILTLGISLINVKENNQIKAEADEPTQYIYLDCTGITASGYSFFHPYVYFGGGGYASEYMLKSVKENVYKILFQKVQHSLILKIIMEMEWSNRKCGMTVITGQLIFQKPKELSI